MIDVLKSVCSDYLDPRNNISDNSVDVAKDGTAPLTSDGATFLVAVTNKNGSDQSE